MLWGFYDTLHRLHDGPIRKTWEHQDFSSEKERRRAKTARKIKRRPKKKTADDLRSVTQKLVDELEATSG